MVQGASSASSKGGSSTKNPDSGCILKLNQMIDQKLNKGEQGGVEDDAKIFT